MPHVTWSDVAQADLRRHFHYLAQLDPGLAARAMKTVRDAARDLAGHPHLGHIVGGTNSKLRVWPVSFGNSGYLLQYSLITDGVLVTAIRRLREAGW